MTLEKIRNLCARISGDGNFRLSEDEFAALIELARPQTLPCDVLLPPRTILRKGCDLETLLLGIAAREKFPADATRIEAADLH